jgi:uncharacterized membrane protein YcjF (UPF0283 family)
MSDDTYIGALRGALRTFRTAATVFGRLDREIEAAWDAHDVERAVYLEEVSAGYAKERRRLAHSLLLATARLEDAGATVPNPRWVRPPWLRREWEAICGREDP